MSNRREFLAFLVGSASIPILSKVVGDSPLNSKRRKFTFTQTPGNSSTHNGFDTGAAGKETAIAHTDTGNVATLAGVLGNNWLFYIPTQGEHAGEVIPFAHGPMRCEMTGPTFVGDTLILARCLMLER